MSKRVKWTDELVESKIKDVMKALRISTMPTRVEIESVMGNSSLTNRISRTVGFRKLAEKMGLPLKDSETKIGNDFEFYIKEKLEELGFTVDKMDTLHPYDVLVNNNIKIDVKVSNWYETPDGLKYHSFGLGKRHHNCDIFILVGLDSNGCVYRTMIIPSKFVMNKKQISCGVESKYNKYINKWDYIEQYSNFYENLK